MSPAKGPLSKLSVDEIVSELTAPYRPDGIVTYLDANMTTFAREVPA